jgi:hypothetical protein
VRRSIQVVVALAQADDFLKLLDRLVFPKMVALYESGLDRPLPGLLSPRTIGLDPETEAEDEATGPR